VSQLTLIKGESKSASIAAASIIAKVTRDRLMAEAHDHYPQYGFLQHQGYPTKAHRRAIAQYGPCPLHRRTFRGVVEFLQSEAAPISPVLPACR
jgi:ribonuclease HII